MTGMTRHAFFALEDVLFGGQVQQHRGGGRPQSLDNRGKLGFEFSLVLSRFTNGNKAFMPYFWNYTFML
jgi:hypothetical protein